MSLAFESRKVGITRRAEVANNNGANTGEKKRNTSLGANVMIDGDVWSWKDFWAP